MEKNRLNTKQIKLFQKFTQLNAISGRENVIARELNILIKELNYIRVTDNLGSIFALKKSKNPNAKKVMVVAHMDEVGFMVNIVESNGLIYGVVIGGIEPNAILCNRVVLTNKNNVKYVGTILPLSSKRKGFEDLNINNVCFDFGFSSKEEVEEADIKMGDMICFDSPTVETSNNKLIGKAIDDRYGICLIVELLHELKDIELDYDLYMGGSVQEEVGLRGAQTASYLIAPDLAIVLDCSSDLKYANAGSGEIGKGLLIRVVDRAMISFKSLIDFQIECAKKSKANYQFFTTMGGTDAGVIHKNLDGIPTLNHCICARAIHTQSTIMAQSDYIDAKKSLKYMLKYLTSSKLVDLKGEK
ncbi:MAG: M42 family peptidase [Bacilli bacterium]